MSLEKSFLPSEMSYKDTAQEHVSSQSRSLALWVKVSMREWIYQAHLSEVSAERQVYDSGLVIFYVYSVCDFFSSAYCQKALEGA